MILGRHSFYRKPYINVYKTEVVVGNFTSIAAGLRIIDIKHPSLQDRRLVSNFSFHDDMGVEDYPANVSLGRIFIGNDVLIGACCNLSAGISIGDGAIIRAGSTVTVDVPPYAIMQGNEIRGYRFIETIRNHLLSIAWWNWSDELIAERIDALKDAKNFIMGEW